MTSNEELLELLPREKYSSMDFETLVKAIESIDISVLDRSRTFYPRKQRFCSTEEDRKMEKNEHSREYTKRNRDEISNCRFLFKELEEVKWRLEELLKEYKVETVGMKLAEFVAGFENILKKYLTVNLHKLNPFVLVYREKAVQVMQYEMPTSDNVYATKLVELKQQLETLYREKDTLTQPNFSSWKSRLNQKIAREQGKSDCWECWNEIKTLVLRGQDLKKLVDQLKKQVWDNILAAHYRLFGLLNIQFKSQFDVQRIEEIVKYFTPFSRSPGKLLIKWTPLEEPSFAPPTAPASYVPCLPTQNSSIPSPSNALNMTVEVERTKMDRKRTAPSSFNDESEIKRKFTESSQKTLLENVLASAQFCKVQQSDPIPFNPFGSVPPSSNALEERTPEYANRSSPSFALSTAPAASVPLRKPPCLPTKNSSISLPSNTLDIRSKVEKTEKSDRKAFSIEDLKKILVENSPAPVGVHQVNPVSFKPTALGFDPSPSNALHMTAEVERPKHSDRKESETVVQQINPIPLSPAALGSVPSFSHAALLHQLNRLGYNKLTRTIPPLQAASTPNFLMAMEQQKMMDAFLQQAFQRCQK